MKSNFRVQTGVLEHYLPLLQLNSTPEYYDIILKGAATMCEEDRRITDAIKLYNLAGARDTVISCLARALGELLSEPGGGGVEGQELENIAQQVIRMYDLRGERTKESQEVMKLIRARSAMDRYAQGDMEGALEVSDHPSDLWLGAHWVHLGYRSVGYYPLGRRSQVFEPSGRPIQVYGPCNYSEPGRNPYAYDEHHRRFACSNEDCQYF